MIRTVLVLALVGLTTLAYAQPQESASPPQSGIEQSVVEKTPTPAGVSSLPRGQTSSADAQAWWEKSEWWLVIPTWLLAFVAIGLTLYTARLWKATAATLKETRDNARKELRAYVALDEIFFSEAEDMEPGEHRLRIRNYGQTPAYRLAIWCERASHLPQEGVKPFYDAPVADSQLLHPVQAYTVSLAAAPLYRIGKPGFFTYGRVVYHDVYRQWWVTKFCFRYEGEGSFVPHGDYNHEEGPFEARPA